MRIISGTCRGRKLATLKGMSIRPTSDRVRESIFNIIGQKINGVYVLDLFAGTGAFGIESLSRGAKMALFVDIAKTSCSVIRQNIDLCRFSDKSAVLQADALKFSLPEKLLLKQFKGATKKFDLIFVDPPYEMGFVEKVLTSQELSNLVSQDSLLILEHSIKEKIPDNLQMVDIYDQRQYGKTLISFFKYSNTFDKSIDSI
ncbi:MAG: 16S rRNA (guanine(966)-N(2))-methyltransferase RsmD [Desulfamplus sp.]|nr:16S rRNA (guanine(966)-N(2))-methyltransferase RsmD [Desulfamplus sp.]MBF0242157.1 16S rRNA (guanine(966)-N(2))-methyltransferase RsmD [Desulfamplus sp.]